MDRQYGATWFVLTPTLGGCVVALIVIWVTPANAIANISCAAIVAASSFTGWRLHRWHVSSIERLERCLKATSENQTSLASNILPVWARQLEAARDTGNQAVANLTTHFGSLVVKLENSLIASKHAVSSVRDKGSSRPESANRQEGQSDFHSVISSLEVVIAMLKEALASIRKSRDELMQEITRYAEDIKEIAADSQRLAMQSKLLALNAGIEAARSGNAGRSFAAVVVEMHRLAERSADASYTMGKKVAAVDEAIMKGTRQTQQLADEEKFHVSQVEDTFADVVRRFRLVTDRFDKSVNNMEQEYREIRDDISLALVEFQFQDRVSQALTHVNDSLNELRERTARETSAVIDTAVWLNEMQDRFRFVEEHHNLFGTGNSTVVARETTFFS